MKSVGKRTRALTVFFLIALALDIFLEPLFFPRTMVGIAGLKAVQLHLVYRLIVKGLLRFIFWISYGLLYRNLFEETWKRCLSIVVFVILGLWLYPNSAYRLQGDSRYDTLLPQQRDFLLLRDVQRDLSDHSLRRLDFVGSPATEVQEYSSGTPRFGNVRDTEYGARYDGRVTQISKQDYQLLSARPQDTVPHTAMIFQYSGFLCQFDEMDFATFCNPEEATHAAETYYENLVVLSIDDEMILHRTNPVGKWNMTLVVERNDTVWLRYNFNDTTECDRIQKVPGRYHVYVACGAGPYETTISNQLAFQIDLDGNLWME